MYLKTNQFNWKTNQFSWLLVANKLQVLDVMDLYLIIHVASSYASTLYASCKLIVHSTLKLHQLQQNWNIVEINHFTTTCDHGQIIVDYHRIYFVYIRPYTVQVATNMQLNCNYEIFWRDILIINSLYFHIVVIL